MKYTEENFIGRVFGRLTVTSYIGRQQRRSVWMCSCVCGNSKSVNSELLIRGYTKSCGCLKREYNHNQKNRLTHGMKHTALYDVWQNMNRRCYDPKDKSYKDYGARGIEVCKEWRDAAGFFKDMKESWKPGLTIERVNNNRGYTKDNCIWIPKSRQACNTRNTHWVVYNGVRMCLADAARKSGVSASLLAYRIKNKQPQKHLFVKAK